MQFAIFAKLGCAMVGNACSRMLALALYKKPLVWSAKEAFGSMEAAFFDAHSATGAFCSLPKVKRFFFNVFSGFFARMTSLNIKPLARCWSRRITSVSLKATR